MSVAGTDKAVADAPAENRNLPEGWTWAALGEITQAVHNVNPRDEPHREFRYIDISCIDNRNYRIVDERKFKGNNAPSRARRPIQHRDILFSNVRTYLRNIAMVTADCDADLCSTGFTVIRSNGALEPRYVFYYALTDDFIDPLTKQQTGSNYPATNDRVVMSSRIPVAPLAEQKRIVAKVQALLARTNAARERLAKIPALMKRFRQSVLAAACSGQLTAEWRYGDSPNDNVRDLWNLIYAGDTYVDARYGTSKKCKTESAGTPVLRVPNIARGVLDVADRKYTELPERELNSLALKNGDVIICRTNGSLDLVGKAAVIPKLAQPYAFASYLIRVRLNQSRVLPTYYHAFLSSPGGRDQIEASARSTAGQFNLNLEILRRLQLPLPSLAEQHEIVRRVETLFVSRSDRAARSGSDKSSRENRPGDSRQSLPR